MIQGTGEEGTAFSQSHGIKGFVSSSGIVNVEVKFLSSGDWDPWDQIRIQLTSGPTNRAVRALLLKGSLELTEFV